MCTQIRLGQTESSPLLVSGGGGRDWSARENLLVRESRHCLIVSVLGMSERAKGNRQYLRRYQKEMLNSI